MSRTLSIEAKTKAEMQEAWEWYYQKSIHTSENFQKEILQTIPHITNVNRRKQKSIW